MEPGVEGDSQNDKNISCKCHKVEGKETAEKEHTVFWVL